MFGNLKNMYFCILGMVLTIRGGVRAGDIYIYIEREREGVELFVVRHLLHYYKARVCFTMVLFFKDPTTLGGPTFPISYPIWCR